MNLNELELKFLSEIKSAPSLKETQFTALNPKDLIKTLTAKYKTEWIEWDNTETLYEAINDDFIPGFNDDVYAYAPLKSKLNALKVMCRSDDFWVDWRIFEKCCHAVDESIVLFDQSQPCSPAQCYVAMSVADFIRDEKYDPEIIEYIRCVCQSRGIVYLPGPLSVAQESLDKKNDIELKDKVKAIWNNVISQDKIDPDEIELDEDNALDWQASKLYTIKKYSDIKLGE